MAHPELIKSLGRRRVVSQGRVTKAPERMTPCLVDAKFGVLPFQLFQNGMEMPPKDTRLPELLACSCAKEKASLSGADVFLKQGRNSWMKVYHAISAGRFKTAVDLPPPCLLLDYDGRAIRGNVLDSRFPRLPRSATRQRHK